MENVYRKRRLLPGLRTRDRGQAPLEIGCQRQPTDTRGVLSLTGQAVTEMAIFGSVIFLCFGVLLSYAHNFTEQQALQQQSFRMALQHYEDNGFISYNIIKHYNMPNLGGAFRQGERGSVSAGNSVSWYIGEPESRSFYQINEDLEEIARHEKDDVDTPDEVWNIETESRTEYSANELKQEENEKITTTRSSSNKDDVTTRLKIRYEDDDGNYHNEDDVVFSQRLNKKGRYSEKARGNDIVIEKKRSWETQH